MKKTLLKDTFREIKRTIGRFLAIFFIIALGTAFFVGIKTTCPDMKATANKYYNDNNLMDFSLVSTVGFSNDDITALKTEKDVKGVMPSYSVDAVATFNGKQKVLTISSLSISELLGSNNDINRPKLIEGRMPNKSGECLIESNKLSSVAPSVGDKIALSSGTSSNLSDKLKTVEYTVVGIVDSPIYISKDRGTTTIGSGQVAAFMLIPDIDFKLPYYTGVYLTADLSSTATAYSTEYDNEIATIKKALTSFADKRAASSYAQIKSDAQTSYNKNLTEYNNSVSKANSALSDANSKITASQNQINDGQTQLNQSKISLAKTVSDSQSKISKGKSALLVGSSQYQAKLNAFNLQKQEAVAAGVYEVEKSVFDASQAQLDATKKQLDDTAASLAASQQQLDKSQASGKQQLEAAQSKLNLSAAELKNAKSTFTQNQLQTEQKLSDAKKQLDSGLLQIKNIPTVKWYVLGRDTLSGYVDYQSAADRMSAIAQVFPIIFIMVAILICLTSMSRMVEEQRQYMGTAKALGYSNASIALKFLLYALLASVAGGILGLAIGFSFFPTLIDKAYAILYTLPKLILVFDVPFAVIALITGILVTTLSAMAVCFGELNSNASALMRPRAPKAGKIILLERFKFIWKRLKFSHKVTARNLFRYKSRFFMTVIGVGGCTALLLVGFGLNDAITTMGNKQYGEIDTYQLSANLKNNIESKDIENIQNTLKNQPEFSALQNLLEKSIDIGSDNKDKTCYLVVPDNAADMSNFIELRVRTTQEKIPLTDDGVVLTEKIAEQLDVKVGDSVYIKNGNSKNLTVRVTGICENYLQHYMFMSKALYEKLYGTSPVYNQINVKLKNTETSSQQTVSKAIVSLNGISSVNLMSDNIQRFKDTIKSIYNIVFVLIFSAALLSFIVLFTLTNININERLREIATIKVLGFYDNEVSSYIFREGIILTILGTAFGLVIGVPLAKYVISTAEVDMLMFGRQIYPLSFVYSALLTIIFAWIVNMFMLRTLKKIDMVEALKTVE